MIGGNELLHEIQQVWPRLGAYFSNYIKPAIETTAQNAAVDPVGHIAEPQSIHAINVAVAGEIVHVSHIDNSPVQKGIHYFTEIGVNDPHFTQPIVLHHGTSRTPPPFSLPTKNGSGSTYSYYIRGYSQYPGSNPSKPVLYNGGAPITMGGSTQLTLLPSSGSGTASGKGTQGGQGFGKAQVRL